MYLPVFRKTAEPIILKEDISVHCLEVFFLAAQARQVNISVLVVKPGDKNQMNFTVKITNSSYPKGDVISATKYQFGECEQILSVTLGVPPGPSIVLLTASTHNSSTATLESAYIYVE